MYRSPQAPRGATVFGGHLRKWLVGIALALAFGSSYVIRFESFTVSGAADQARGLTPERVSTASSADRLKDLPTGNTVSFIENAGQWPSEVHFRVTARGGTMWLTDDGVYHQLTRVREESTAELGLMMEPERVTEQILIHARLVGGTLDSQPVAESKLAHYANFFIGNDPSRWRSHVGHYASVLYDDVYPGIDLQYYVKDGKPAYDYVIEPGADPEVIRVAYDGVEAIQVDELGNLVLETEFGSIVESAPFVYQQRGLDLEPISARFSERIDGTIGFEIDDSYDRTLALVIDPTIEYGSYFGGSAHELDGAQSIAHDTFGNIVIAGNTQGGSTVPFPLVNPVDSTRVNYEAFVAKFDSSWTLQFSTYLGGDGNDYGISVGTDASGFIYTTGTTTSANFATANPAQGSLGGLTDLFLTKFPAAGDTILYSTYLGGAGGDGPRDMAVTPIGDVYLVGTTSDSVSFPTTIGAFQTTYGGGVGDGFVAKLSPLVGGAGSLVYSSYFGGSGSDDARGVVVDPSGQAIVALGTGSADLPTDHDGPSGFGDIYMGLISAGGDALVAATYFGGGNGDVLRDLSLGPNGYAYVCGYSSSSYLGYGGYEPNNAGGLGPDAIVGAFDPASSMQPIASTFLGGTEADIAYGIHVDPQGYVYVTGSSESNDFPMFDPIDATHDNSTFGFPEDAFVAVLSSRLQTLDFSTYIGGDRDDRGNSITVDGSSVFVTGLTTSTDFPVTGGAFDPTYNAANDAFILEISGLTLDADGDGVESAIDNCPGIPNADQADDDLDSVGNVCDNCPTTPNYDQVDADLDGIGDACDVCATDPLNDVDGDGVCGDVDNCPFANNPDQTDGNGNGIGDACDIGQVLRFFLFSPVDMVVTDPMGDSIGIGFNTIGLGSDYDTLADSNSATLTGPDGEPDDIVTIPNPLVGDYQVKIIPEPGASGGDVFSLSIRINGNQLLTPEDYYNQPVSALGTVISDTYVYTTALTLPGDANADGSITSADIIHMVNYVFKGGAPPIVPGHGDVNCDGVTTSADIIAMVGYVFKGGPPPCSQTTGP